nr:uncharacterized protein LOC128686692 isoform X2 [Cherax quadricarinatus]
MGEDDDVPELKREEAEEFVTRVLELNLPETYPANIAWINQLIQAFQMKQPFQNITLLSNYADRHVPSWEDIHRDIFQEGKGGLCLSLNFAFAAVLRSFGVCAYSAAANYVPTGGRGVHVITVIDVEKTKRTCWNF